MKKLQIIVIVFLILFSISTFPSMPAKACNAYTYTASISPTLTDAGLTGVSYTITFTDTASSDMGSGTITIPTGYTTVSLTSVTASNGDSWSGSVSSSTMSFTASQGDDEISNGQTVTVVFSATNPSSAGSYTWTTAAYSDTSECGTRFTISGCQPSVTVNAGTATHLMVSCGTTQTAGVAFSVMVTAEDEYGNVATGYTGTVHFTSSDSGTGVVLPSNYKFNARDDGSYKFTNGVILVTVTTTGWITATDTVTSSITGSQTGITVTPAGLASIVVSPSSATIMAGGSQAFTAEGFDAYGNDLGDYTASVTWSIDSGAGGSWTANSVTAIYAGTWTVTATDGLISGTASLTVTHASAVSIVVSPATATIMAGGSQAFTATDKDAHGNTWDVTSTVTWSISAGADGSVSAGGLATADKTGTWTIEAVDGFGNIGTASLTVTPGVATQLVVSSSSETQTAGVPFSVTVTAEDAYGNVATSYNGTVQFTSSDGQAVLPVDSTLSSGTGTFSVTLETAGTQSIAATDTVTNTITGSLTVTVNPAGASYFVVSGFPNPTTAGVSGTVTVTAYDQYGNVATGYLGTVAFTSSDTGAGVVLPGEYTFTAGDAGVASFSVTLVTAGSQSITATDTLTPSITGSQTGITVNPAGLNSITISPSSATVMAGGSQAYTAEGFDAFGNDLGDVTSTATFSVNGVSIAGNSVTEDLVGVYTVTASIGNVVSNAASLTVTAGPLASITISPSSASIVAGGSQTYSATATDLFGNTWDVTGSVTWSIDSGAGGSWSGATYTSANVGSWTVKAALGGVFGTASLTVNAVTYQITVISAHGSPTASALVNAGGSFTASVTSPESAGVGQQWICTGYSIDGGPVVSGTSYTFTDIQSNHTITFNWQEQYYLTTITNFGSVDPASGWYDAGSTVTLSATAPSAGSGEQYVWNGWTGVGTGSYTGTDNPTTGSEVTMNGPITEAASWTHQYQVTFDASSNVKGDSSATIVTVNGVPETATSLPYSVWVDSGSSVSYSFAGLVASSSASTTQYRWGTTSGIDTAQSDILAVTGAGTVTGNYVTQYDLQFAVSGLDSSAQGTVVSVTVGANPAVNLVQSQFPYDFGYVDAGTVIKYTFTSAVGSSNSGEQFVLTTPAATPASGFSLNGATTVTGTYKTQFEVSFSQTGISSDAGTNSVLTLNGVTYTYNDLPTGMWVNAGTSFSWSSPVAGVTGEQFVYTGDSGLASPITGPGTDTSTYVTQYYLTVQNGGYGSASGSGWYDAGVSAPFSISPTTVPGATGVQYVLTSWSGSGTGAYSGSSSSSSVTMNNPITETANWQTQYYLTVTSAYGSTTGSGWYNSGATAYAGLNSGTVSGGTGTQYVFAGWGSDASGTNYAQSVAITMNSPMTATANWQTQYQLTFAVIGSGSTMPTGSNVWENAGSLSITATPNTGYSFSSWSSNTESITFNSANSASTTATIGGTGTITATFTINTYTITVTQGANGVIAPGTSVVDYGATPSFSITPNTGYYIASITADGASVTVISASGQSYQFSAVSANGSLTATFAATTSKTIVSSPSPTPIVTSPSPTPKGSSASPTPTVVSPSPTPLYVVLVAVIFVAIILLIAAAIAIKRSRRKLDKALSKPKTSIQQRPFYAHFLII